MHFEDIPRHTNNTKVLVNSLVWGSLCFPDYANLLILITVDSLTLRHICAQLEHVSYKWFKIGLHLRIPRYKLMEFKEEDDPLAAAVGYWLCGNVEGVPVTWRSIVAALNSTRVGENLLAKRIYEKYCQQQGIVRVKGQSIHNSHYLITWKLIINLFFRFHCRFSVFSAHARKA